MSHHPELTTINNLLSFKGINTLRIGQKSLISHSHSPFEKKSLICLFSWPHNHPPERSPWLLGTCPWVLLALPSMTYVDCHTLYLSSLVPGHHHWIHFRAPRACLGAQLRAGLTQCLFKEWVRKGNLTQLNLTCPISLFPMSSLLYFYKEILALSCGAAMCFISFNWHLLNACWGQSLGWALGIWPWTSALLPSGALHRHSNQDSSSQTTGSLIPAGKNSNDYDGVCSVLFFFFRCLTLE